MSSKKVLALDLGPTSIGWALVDESDNQIVAAGARVFPEGVNRDTSFREESKNKERRDARAIRRQVARRARRKRQLREALVGVGLLPAVAALPASDAARRAWEQEQFKKANPYALRSLALETRIELFDLGRILLHLAQHRGFLSNRKADKQKKEETSDTLKQINELQIQMGEKSLGQHLAELQRSQPEMRIRGRHTRREMYLDELKRIWAKQREYYPDLLTDQLLYGQSGPCAYPCPPKRRGQFSPLEAFGLHGMIFFQRPIYWPKSVVGQCELNPKEKRCPRADRAAQELRVLQEVNNLLIICEDGEIKPLSEEQRDTVLLLLQQKDSVKFDDIRKKLRLGEGDGFNLEAGQRKKLDGMTTDVKLSSPKLFGKSWRTRPDSEKNALVRSLIRDDEPTFLRRAAEEWKVELELGKRLLEANLVEGYASYGLSTIERLLPFIRKRLPLLSHDKTPCAVREAGFLAPWDREIKPGRYLPDPPAVTNPIVRQALFQVRKLVNAVVREYGKPDAIHIELARDVKGTSARRAEMSKTMRARESARDDAAAEIEKAGEAPTRNKIERYLLWKEQREVCMYSGKPISLPQLLGGEADVDHVLPYSKSLDNSLMNKVICFRAENADKGQRTIYEWLAETNTIKYEEILQRAAKLPIEIRNRKRPLFSQKTCELEHFINRQLSDTAFITSAVMDYLRNLGVDVLGSKGQLTAELRHQWGLNSVLREDDLNLKNREDHRHHAVDAMVIAMTNHSRLQQLARSRGNEPLALPWSSFRDDAQRVVNQIYVSHRARRKIAGPLHDETIYGATQKSAVVENKPRPWAKNWQEKDGVYVFRKPLESLSLNEVDKIRDDRIRELVIQRLVEYGLRAGRKKKGNLEEDSESAKGSIPKRVWEKPLFLPPAKKTGTPTRIRKVRLLKPEESIRPLGANAVKFVKPANLHHIAFFERTDHKGNIRREAVFVSMLEASKRLSAKQPLIQHTHPDYPQARFVMSLSRGEMLQATFKGQERLVRFSTAASTQGQIYCIEHTDARPSASVKKFAANANTLDGRKVFVDILGRLRPAND